MKPFQSRVVAAWIVALPIAYGLFLTAQHRADRLRADPQFEIARQLRERQHVSFPSFFVLMFVMVVILTVVIDKVETLIRRLFPDRAEIPKPVA